MSSSPTERAALVDVEMPQMGVSVAEGTVVEWKKRPGDRVEADETIVEISTDKIDSDIPAPVSGVVRELLVEENATVPVGTVLARIDPDGDAAGGRSSDPNGAGAAPAVTPVVRRIAADHGIDPGTVKGSGRGGRVTKRDLLAHIEAARPEPGGGAPVLHGDSPYREEPPVADEQAPDGGEPLSPMRRQIAEHMLRSLRTAAHCTTVVEADMSRIEAARGSLSYLPFVAHATIGALREHPSLNATLEGDRLTEHEAVHLGIAVELPGGGLIVPVVHDAHELSHEGLARRIGGVAARAREGGLSPDEVRGGTFTITNPGRYGALLATPIINQPQVAILDLEAVVRRPVAVGEDAVGVRPMTYLCLSWDHRAIDGVLAAKFLAGVRRRLEEWDG